MHSCCNNTSDPKNSLKDSCGKCSDGSCTCSSATARCPFFKLIFSWLLVALGVGIAAHTSKGISYDSWVALLTAVVVLSLFNVVLKPILVLFTLPFVILTMGLGLWFINAGLLMLVGKMVTGFHVQSFSSALWGALVISLISFIINVLWSPRIRDAWRNRGACSKASAYDKSGAKDI